MEPAEGLGGWWVGLGAWFWGEDMVINGWWLSTYCIWWGRKVNPEWLNGLLTFLRRAAWFCALSHSFSCLVFFFGLHVLSLPNYLILPLPLLTYYFLLLHLCHVPVLPSRPTWGLLLCFWWKTVDTSWYWWTTYMYNQGRWKRCGMAAQLFANAPIISVLAWAVELTRKFFAWFAGPPLQSNPCLTTV